MNKVVIVTGASRGIGREIAKTLAENGLKVIANYNKSQKEAEALREELKNRNIEIRKRACWINVEFKRWTFSEKRYRNK